MKKPIVTIVLLAIALLALAACTGAASSPADAQASPAAGNTANAADSRAALVDRFGPHARIMETIIREETALEDMTDEELETLRRRLVETLAVYDALERQIADIDEILAERAAESGGAASSNSSTAGPLPNTGRGTWAGTPLEECTDEQLRSSRDFLIQAQVIQKGRLARIDEVLEERAAGARSVVAISEGSQAGNSYDHFPDEALQGLRDMTENEIEMYQVLIDRYDAELAERAA